MPDWKHEILKRLAGLKLAPAREAEIAEELSQHLEDRFHELVLRGATEDDARRMALAELGDGLAATVAPPFGAAPAAGLKPGATPETAGPASGTDAAKSGQDELARGLRRVEAEVNQEPVVAGHLETFLARQRERGRLVPRGSCAPFLIAAS